MIEGSPYEGLVAINEKPLSAEQDSQEQKKLNETIQHRRNESQAARTGRIPKYPKDR
jgi:hypothetical protein